MSKLVRSIWSTRLGLFITRRIRAAVMREARKVIGPDGEFRLMLYAEESWKDAMIEAGFDLPEAQSGCKIAFTSTREEARLLVEQAGFRVVSIALDRIFPSVVGKYVRYEYEL